MIDRLGKLLSNNRLRNFEKYFILIFSLFCFSACSQNRLKSFKLYEHDFVGRRFSLLQPSVIITKDSLVVRFQDVSEAGKITRINLFIKSSVESGTEYYIPVGPVQEEFRNVDSLSLTQEGLLRFIEKDHWIQYGVGSPNKFKSGYTLKEAMDSYK